MGWVVLGPSMRASSSPLAGERLIGCDGSGDWHPLFLKRLVLEACKQPIWSQSRTERFSGKAGESGGTEVGEMECAGERRRTKS